MSLFKQYAKSYLDNNMCVIPGKAGSKRPAIKKWTEFAHRMPSEEDLEQWYTIQNTNLDLMLGEISGVIALDLDCEDAEVLDLIEGMLPSSPCGKIGSKGWTRFFKYTGEETNILKHNGKVILEVLSTGKKTTIPPSIHPNGDAYVWEGTPLNEIDIKRLPILPPFLLTSLENALRTANVDTWTNKVINGRNDALKAFCAKMIGNRVPLENAIQQLIKFDKDNHEVPLFVDDSDFRVKSGYINAAKFYVNNLESINYMRQMKGKNLEEPSASVETLPIVQTLHAVEQPEHVNPPQPSGLLKDLVDYIISRSYIPQPELALSASLVTLSTLISRKVTFCGSAPNLYCLNIAPSGSGKDAPQQAIKELFLSLDAEKLLGAGDYVSDASLVDTLQEQPVRIDIMDECAGLLKAINNGERGFEARMSDVLCELYTSSNSRYLGRMTASEGRKGSVNRPGVNILGSTTFKGLKESLSLSSLEKGLLGRFVIFQGRTDQRAQRLSILKAPERKLLDKLNYWFRFVSPTYTGDMPYNSQVSYEMEVTSGANNLLDRYFSDFDNHRRSLRDDDIVLPIAARLYQQMIKFVMLSAVSECEVGELPVIQEKDVEWGHALISYYYHYVKDFVTLNLHENKHEQNVNRMLQLIKDSGSDGITRSNIGRKTKFLTKRIREEILMDLVDSGQIVSAVKTINSKSQQIFYPVRA